MPRMIQTNPCVSRFSGRNRLMEPKATTSPSGRENASVKKKIFTVSQKPLSSSIVTGRNINGYLSPTGAGDATGACFFTLIGFYQPTSVRLYLSASA